MAHVYHEVREVRTRNDDDLEPVSDRSEYGMTVAQRVIYFISGVIIALLALRLLLSLLGANQANGFANFIYSASHPFAAPFFGLFNYQPTYGASRFELGTLVAIVVYAVLAALLARLVSLGSRDRTDV